MIKKISTLAAIAISSAFITSCDDDDNNNANNLINIPNGSTNVAITFTANGPVAFAPMLFVAHDGQLDFFNTGSQASAELETMAEVGDISGLQGTLRASDNSVSINAPTAPGSTVTLNLTVDQANAFFSFVGMALPSSDTFVGNNIPTQFNLRQLLSSNNDTIVIPITRLYDAGTEVNDFLTSPGGPLVGAPAGVATDGVAENGLITLSSPTFYNSYLNAGAFDASSINPNNGVVGTITITRIK